ncbi:MAG: GNAT family N-acetyltransferase [Sphingomicrobium sp.]
MPVQERVSVIDGFADPQHAQYLARHYADRPLRYLPAFIIQRLVRRWRGRPDVFFLVARLGDRTAGFLLGQAAGAKPWRKLLADPLTLPFATAALIRQRLGGKEPSSDVSASARAYPRYDDAADRAPSDWRSGDAANVEFIFVDPAFRGRDIAAQLLGSFVDRLRSTGIRVALAYIATTNASSTRAFTKAGWSIYQDGHSLRAVRTIECT